MSIDPKSHIRYNYIPDISRILCFGLDAVSAAAAARQARACVSRNCDTNAHIQFIFYLSCLVLTDY